VDDNEDDGHRIALTTERLPLSLPTCMQTGAHYFKLAPAASRYDRRPIYARCEHCELERYFPPRPRRGRQDRDRAASATRLHAAAHVERLPPRRDIDETDFDGLLEALSYLGGGDISQVTRLVEQSDDAPWATAEAARALSALGHIDISYSTPDLRLAEWAVAPATLVVPPDGDAFLAGWRSEELLTALGSCAVRLGGAVRWDQQNGGPTRVRVTGLDGDALIRLVEAVRSSTGRDVELARDPARRIAELLPSLDELRGALPLTSPPDGRNVERRDADTARWRSDGSATKPGLYRTRRLPRRAWHFDGNDWRAVEPRSGRWLAGRDAMAMLAWSEEHQQLACHVGAPLPGLYERAVVLCTGLVPQTLDGRFIIYAGVNKAVATHVAASLAIPALESPA
jgi:hypothetical protein